MPRLEEICSLALKLVSIGFFNDHIQSCLEGDVEGSLVEDSLLVVKAHSSSLVAITQSPSCSFVANTLAP